MGAEVLIGARFLQFMAALVLFGAPLFFLYGLETSAATPDSSMRCPWRHRLLLVAATVALLGSLIWVMAETASMGDSPSDAVNPAALWMILSDTRFGRACLTRIALLFLSLIVSLSIPTSKRLWILQALFGGAVTLSFAWTGHGAVDRGIAGAFHLGADLLHLLAAGIWIGALLPLTVMVVRSIRSKAESDARSLHLALARFSTIGIPVVAVLVLSGLVNSGFLIGPSRWRALLTTDYGVVLLIKLGVFGLMLVLAGLNRYRTTPTLRAALQMQVSTQSALGALRKTVLTETILAFLVLLAVSVLGTLTPPVSIE